jgi:hypothetical protein
MRANDGHINPRKYGLSRAQGASFRKIDGGNDSMDAFSANDPDLAGSICPALFIHCGLLDAAVSATDRCLAEESP